MVTPTVQATTMRSLLREHRGAVHSILNRYGARNPRLFGSIARGDATEASDVDLLVDLDKRIGLFALARLERELSELLGADVEVVPANSLREHARSSVLAYAVPV